MQYTYYRSREIWQKEFMEECNAKDGMKKCHLEAEKSHWKEETHSVSISIPNPFRPLYYILFNSLFKDFIKVNLHAYLD